MKYVWNFCEMVVYNVLPSTREHMMEGNPVLRVLTLGMLPWFQRAFEKGPKEV